MTRKALFGIICGLVLAAVSLSSCAPAGYISKEAEFNNAWVGKTHQEIVAAYGAPTREVTDGKDGTILVYEEFSTSVYGPAYPYRHYPWGGWYGHDVYTRTNRDYADFFINGEGTCYLVRSNIALPGGEYDRASHTAVAVIAGVAVVCSVASLIALLVPMHYVGAGMAAMPYYLY
ncbi:MAG: hypothetical protein K6F25_10380 [Bacteroidales bacterium]|jgi:hypothetical protein|nr:hypothetical protein [Bacteroidales bacterium]